MVSQKGKRFLEYNMEKYYWFVRPDRTGAMKIHMLNPGHCSIQRELLDKHYLRKHGSNAYYCQK